MITENESEDPGLHLIAPDKKEHELIVYEQTDPTPEVLDEENNKLLAILKQQADLSVATITKTFENKLTTRIEMNRELKVKGENVTLKENIDAEGTGNEEDKDKKKQKWTHQNTIELFARIGVFIVILSCMYGFGSLLVRIFKS